MSNKKDTNSYETVDNTVQEGYSAHGEYAAQQGEYDYTDPNQYYTDPNQYYYGYNNQTDASNAGYNYDQYYQQYYDSQAATGYDASAYNNAYTNAYYKTTDTTLPESVASIVANSASASKPSKYSNTSSASTAPTSASVSAPNPYYANANSNNPQLPIVLTKTGYTGPNATPPPPPTPTGPSADTKKKGKQKKLVRQAGGELWEDNSLLEWDDNDFRLFAGDLGNEVTEELLYKAFSKYPSLLRTRVVRDKRTMKSKGFGFISFKDPDDFVRAWREMNGKYVGNRPIKLRKSNWKERNIDVRAKKERERVGPYPKIR